MVRSAATPRVSNHEAIRDHDSTQPESALAPFLSRFSLWRWHGRPPLLEHRSVLQSGPLQAGRIGLTLQTWLLQVLLLPSARPVLRRWQPGVRRRTRWRTRPLLQPLPVRSAGLLLSRPVWLAWLPQTWLLRTRSLRQTILSLRTGLTRLVATVVQAGIGAAEGALLGDDATAEILRGVDLTHKPLVAQRLPRRDRQRHRGKTCTSRAGADGKTAGALREKAEPRTGAVIDLDPADLAVGVGIELDRDVVAACRRRAFWHFDQAAGAADTERCRRCRDFHVAGLGDGGGNEGNRALGDIEQRGVLFAAVLIDIIVDRDPRVGGEIERGGVVEGDAKRRIRRGLQHVVEKDIVLGLQRCRLVVAGHGGAAGQRGDVADRLVVRGLRIGGRVSRRRSG